MGGKKAKKMKNSGPEKKSIIYPDNDQYYAIAEKFHSHSNIDVLFVDKDEEGNETLANGIGVMRGKIIKRVKKVSPGDIFIISKRDFETVKSCSKQKVDILHKYNDMERSEVIRYLHNTLKSALNKDTNNSSSSNINNSDSEDEVCFTTQDSQQYKKTRRAKSSYQNNTITTNYLDGFDLPSDDEEVNDESIEDI